MKTENNKQPTDQILLKIKLEKDCASGGTLTTEYHEHYTYEYDVMSKLKLENDCANGATVKTENSEQVTDDITLNIKQENSFIGDTVTTGSNKELEDPLLSKAKLENDCASLGNADHSPSDPAPNICACEVCGWSFKDLNSFHQHVKSTHHLEEQNQGQSSAPEETVPARINREDPVFSCALCGEKYGSQYYLNRHHCDALESKVLLIEMNHCRGVETVYECFVCSRIFNGRYTWRRHMDIHLGQQKEQCALCFRRFSDTRDVRRHMKRTHSKELKQNNLMQSHESGAKKKRGSDHVRECLCNVCGMSFRSMMPLRKHMRIHAESHPFLCCYCYQSFRFIEIWTEHTKQCYNGSPQSVSQKKLQKENPLESENTNLTDRGRRYPPRSKFRCHECGKIFKLGINLLEHERNEHSSDTSVKEDERNQGLGCGKEDAIPGQTFTEHVKVNKKKGQMVHCALCREELPLQYHPYRHKCDALERKLLPMESDVKSENSLDCPVGNVFFTSQSWQRHMDVQLGQQNYDGPVCGNQYSRSKDVNEQMRTHTDNHSMKCEHSPEILCLRDAVKGCENTHNALCSSSGKTSLCEEDVTKHLFVDHASESDCFLSVGCGKGFKSDASFQQHGIEQHSISPQSPGLQSLPSSALLVSTEEKKYEEKYQCFFCDKDLKTEEKLKSHLRIHTGV